MNPAGGNWANTSPERPNSANIRPSVTGLAGPARLKTIFAAIAIALILGLGLVSRWASLDEPLWLDELHTAWCVHDSFGEVARRAWEGNQSPLFFWLEYPVFQISGGGPVALRSLSLMASLVLLVSMAWLAWRWSGSYLAAIVSAGLAAQDDQFIFYAVEARPYALVQLAALWQVALFIRLLSPRDDPTRTPAAMTGMFGLLSLGLFYLHLSTVLLFASELLIGVFVAVGRWPRHKIHAGSPWLWVCLAAGLPGWAMGWRLAGRGADWNIISDPGRYALLVVAYVLVWLAGPVALLATGSGQSATTTSPGPRRSWPEFGLALTGLLPPAMAWMATCLNLVPLAQFRFTIGSFALLAVLAGILVGRIRGARMRLAVTVMVLGLATVTNPLLPALMSRGEWPDQRDENWQEMTRRLNRDRAPVALWPNLVEDRRFAESDPVPEWQEYYRFAVTGIYRLQGLDDGRQVIARSLHGPQQLSSTQVSQFEQHGGGWLLIRARSGDARQVVLQVTRQFEPGWSVTVHDLSLPPLYLYRLTLSGNSTGEGGGVGRAATPTGNAANGDWGDAKSSVIRQDDGASPGSPVAKRDIAREDPTPVAPLPGF